MRFNSKQNRFTIHNNQANKIPGEKSVYVFWFTFHWILHVKFLDNVKSTCSHKSYKLKKLEFMGLLLQCYQDIYVYVYIYIYMHQFQIKACINQIKKNYAKKSNPLKFRNQCSKKVEYILKKALSLFSKYHFSNNLIELPPLLPLCELSGQLP